MRSTPIYESDDGMLTVRPHYQDFIHERKPGSDEVVPKKVPYFIKYFTINTSAAKYLHIDGRYLDELIKGLQELKDHAEVIAREDNPTN